jgi:DNA repair exonuclease SbcCD ATPase subunit
MRVINLKAENIKKLTAIDITPTDSLVMVTGPNGAGKSSVLDSICMGLCGGKAIPAVPIKKGSDKGKIVIDLGEFTITRSFTKDNSYLKIENKDGSNISSPQKFLDKIVGNISFDPLDFLNNEKIKQRNILLQLLGVNVDELDKKEKALRDERTIIGRDVTKLKAVYQSENHYPEIKATE